MRTRSILGLALGLAALTTMSAAAVADASASRAHHQRHAAGRISSISDTSVTVNGTSYVPSARQLAGLALGQCVEVESRVRQGVASVTRIKREDRCATAATTPVSTTPGTTTPGTNPVTGDDDGPQHDLGDDDANASVDPSGRHGGDSSDSGNGSDD